MTLLSVCQEVSTEFGIVPPTQIIDSTDPNALKLKRLADKSGKLIAKRHDWNALLIMHTWTATATQEQADGPRGQDDYDHIEYNAELWNTTTSTKYVGPYGGNAWHTLVSSTVSGMGAVPAWRLIRGALNIYPVPTAGDTLSMPYISGQFVHLTGSGSSYGYTFSNDTDVVLYPEHLLKLDMVWRWKQSNGLDYAEDMSDFERTLDLEAARDAGTRVMVPRNSTIAMPSWSGSITGV